MRANRRMAIDDIPIYQLMRAAELRRLEQQRQRRPLVAWWEWAMMIGVSGIVGYIIIH